MLRIWLTCLILPCLGFGKVKDQLELFLDIRTGDSVVSITQTGPARISVLVADSARTGRRTVEGEASAAIIEKLKANAGSESIPWIVSDIQPEIPPGPSSPKRETGAAAPDAEGKEEKASQENLRKNKFKYVSTQTLFSTYTYGLALPIAFEAPDKAAALGLLALPVSFGAHYYFAWNKEYRDSHLFATSYFAANSLIFAYGIPFIVLGPDLNAFRVGTFAVLGAYPLGLHYGYKHGTRFQDEPGRISLQSSWSFTMGVMGYLGVFLWAEQVESSEVGVRLGLAQVLGAGIAGHYLSYKYRAHEKIPGGIGPGIGTFSLLGGMAAGSLLASIKPESAPTVGGVLLAGVGAGFLSGVKFFSDKYDNFERSEYNTLGLTAGAVTPLGLMLLMGSVPDDPAALMWTVTAGGFAGYFLTRQFTASLVERPRSVSSANGFLKSFAFNPVPIPVPETVNGRHTVKFVAPILTASF